jgi:hypothetical protein
LLDDIKTLLQRIVADIIGHHRRRYRSVELPYVGNPNLKPEDGLGADLTGEFAPGERFGLNATVYGQYTTDSIHWIKSAGDRWSPENIGTAWFIGADLRPTLKAPLDRAGFTILVLGASCQYQLNWLLSGDLDFEDACRIPYMPTHIVGGSIDLSWGKDGSAGSLLLSAHYETTRYANTTNDLILAPYYVLHATVNQGLGKHFTTLASFRNIRNSHYESFAGYYMPRVSLAPGTKAKW